MRDQLDCSRAELYLWSVLLTLERARTRRETAPAGVSAFRSLFLKGITPISSYVCSHQNRHYGRLSRMRRRDEHHVRGAISRRVTHDGAWLHVRNVPRDRKLQISEKRF